MDLDIKGEKALVLSSTRGLGFACAKALVAEGVEVVINGRDADRGAQAQGQLGPGAHFIKADLSQPHQVHKLIREAQEYLGPISIFVPNVEGPGAQEFLKSTTEDWIGAVQKMLTPVMEAIRVVVPPMISSGFGRVVNISSISAKEITPNAPFANGIRPLIGGALGTLARDVAATGVTVNSILAGPFNTDLLKKVARRYAERSDLSEEEAVQIYVEAGPMKRAGQPDELGALCAFLCSRAAGYITGQSVVIDGGRLRTQT